MARDDKAKVRVFFGEIEGDNATIRDGLKSIAAAVNRTFSGEVRIMKALKNGGTERAEEEDRFLDDPIATASDAEFDEKPKSPRPKKAPSYKTVSNLNLMPDGKQSLRAFFESKKPKTQQEQFVVILFYLTHVLGVTNVSPDHIYTGFNEAEQPVPNIDSMAGNISNRKGWIDASEINNLKLTVPGENFVKHKLPSAVGKVASPERE